MSITAHRMTRGDTGIKERLQMLAPSLAALLYPFALEGFYRRFATRVRCSAADAEGSQASAMYGSWLACSSDSWQGRNHHNFNEHPRSPKVGREASPRRRVCRIDPLIPNRIVFFKQTHVSDPDLDA